ncbi:hypothetical protein TNCV_366071 [Trichonephila clavipes]|nr:hypothetical protein TNCV_366071 [Trichonephila clavipes]
MAPSGSLPQINLGAQGMHQTKSACNPSINNKGASSRIMVRLCQRVTCGGNCKPMSNCVLLLKDTILSMSDRLMSLTSGKCSSVQRVETRENVCIPKIELDTRGVLDMPFLLKRTSSKQWFVRRGIPSATPHLKIQGISLLVLPFSVRGSGEWHLLASPSSDGKESFAMSRVNGRFKMVLRNNSKLHMCLCTCGDYFHKDTDYSCETKTLQGAKTKTD